MENDRRIIPYSIGLCYASVCAEKNCTIEEITDFLNISHPTGIATDWELSKEDFVTGQKNGCDCENDSEERVHYLFCC